MLNSSTACFWLKQNSHNKGNGGGSSGDESDSRGSIRTSSLAPRCRIIPLPSVLPLERGRELDRLAQELAAHEPSAVCRDSDADRCECLQTARAASDEIRARMIAVQEELDWEVYRLYGLIDEDLTYGGDDLPGLALGERAFEIALARAVAGGRGGDGLVHPARVHADHGDSGALAGRLPGAGAAAA